MSAQPVLFANHTGEVAGAERSMLDLLDGLSGRLHCTAASPRGDLFDALEDRGVEVREIPSSSLSFRPHPLHTPRGVAELIRAGRAIREMARSIDARVIHANTERAGLAVAAVRRRGDAPLAVHARAPFPENRLGGLTARVLAARADAIVANSHYTALQFQRHDSAVVEVVHNPIDTRRFDPEAIDRGDARAALGLAGEGPMLAVVGYLAPIKRQDDAIRILAAVRGRHEAARLLVVGGTRFAEAATRSDNVGYADGLQRLVTELGLGDAVTFTGEQDDVRGALAAADILLVPSLREGFGRVALEGMAMGIPVIATAAGGTSEVVRDGIDGFLLEPGDPPRWADAVLELLARPDLRAEMGGNGRGRAMRDFSTTAHVNGVLNVYERLGAPTPALSGLVA